MALRRRRLGTIVVAGLVAGASLIAPLAGATTSPLLGSGDHYETIVVGHLSRSFLVQVANGSPVGRPLVLVYGGASDSIATTRQRTNFWWTANVVNDTVVYLQGFQNSWNVDAQRSPAEMAHVDDIAFTNAVLATLVRQLNYNTHAVAAVGFSNGALMVDRLGCQDSRFFSLILPVEGEIPVDLSHGCSLTHPVSVYTVHSTADSEIPYNGGHFNGMGGGNTVLSAPAAAARWAQLDHCALRTNQRVISSVTHLRTYGSCPGGVTVTLHTIVGGGHAWPSDMGQIAFSALGQWTLTS